MLTYVLIGLGVLIVLFIAAVALQPGEFRTARSAIMSAPPSAVFNQVNDFHNWKAWSPWAKLDPAMTETYEGPASGVGAKYSWVGNNKVGAGRMTIAESRPSDLLRIQLEFLKPFKATNMAEFTFKPEGSHTAVEWAMTGRKNFMMKGFCMVMNMDKVVGKDFEKGLAQMKAVVEAGK